MENGIDLLTGLGQVRLNNENKKKRKYLGEVIDSSSTTFANRNLILSPVGSGKTHFMLNELVKRYKGKKLLLVSTTSLKDSLMMKDNIFSTKDLKKKGELSDEEVHLMTYSEFGKNIVWDNGDFIEQYSVIFCDEIHSLFDYFSFTKSYMLSSIIKTLFISKDKDIKVFYFTATIGKINQFMEKNLSTLMENVKVIDYLKKEDIVSHDNAMSYKFQDVSGIMDLIGKLDGFTRLGNKGLIFTEKIGGMKEIYKMLEMKAYKTIMIWSTNNKDYPMTKEQLRVRRVMLETGMVPDEYDFVIINGAMREGWDLIDERVQLVILNTTDETSKTQARGRIRNDIFILAERGEGHNTTLEERIMEREKSVRSIGSKLNKQLTTSMKDRIANELYVKNENNRLVKWRAIKAAIEKNGYTVEEKRVVKDGKQVRVSIIRNAEIAPY